MNKKIIAGVALCSMVAGMASATLWNGSGGTSGSVKNWNDGANWEGGVAPTALDDARFWYDRSPVEITDAQSITDIQLEKGALYVRDGGSLTGTGGWSGFGLKDAVTLVNIEAGGSMSFADHLWLGYNANATDVTINLAGTLSVAGNIGIGSINATTKAGEATLNVLDGGLLNLNYWDNTGSIQAGSVLNIDGTGQVIVGGNCVTAANNYFTAGKITSDQGAILATFDGGLNQTTIIAIPEPATLGLITAFGGGILFIRRRFMI